jgi:hypothetical protein
MEKQFFPLMKIPPLRGGDFQGMSIYRPMPVSAYGCPAREKIPSFSRAVGIGSMSPTRLSLSMVASLQSPLLFHLASSL